MHVKPGIVMFAVLGLQSGDELGQGALLFGHHVGEQQAIQYAVALRKMASDTDAARLLAANQDVTFEHEVADVLEADAALIELAVMLGGDTIKHLGGVEGADDLTGPFLALQNPAQKNRVNLMGVHKAAIFGDGTDAISVAVSDEAAVALFAHNHLLCSFDVRLDRLGIDSGKERVYVGSDFNVLDPALFEDAGKDSAAGAMHAVDQKLETRFGDDVEIGKLSDAVNVWLSEVGLCDLAGGGGPGSRC